MASSSLNTIGDLLHGNYFLAVCCHACARTVGVPLAELCAARGEGYLINRVRDAAKCQECGARGKHVSIRIGYRGYTPPTRDSA